MAPRRTIGCPCHVVVLAGGHGGRAHGAEGACDRKWDAAGPVRVVARGCRSPWWSWPMTTSFTSPTVSSLPTMNGTLY
eukprot:9094649-Pyramimonas_sp.AAC.2